MLRESLSCYISVEDLSVLQERTELLHRQWDEICHQVSTLPPHICFEYFQNKWILSTTVHIGNKICYVIELVTDPKYWSVFFLN